jgi:hypothetical protein
VAEELDDRDLRVIEQLGYAVARAQLLEVQMVRLLEAQRHDLAVPLDDRWDEISKWLRLTAGQLKDHLRVPEVVAKDLKALVGRRNDVAHHAWVRYVAARGIQTTDTAPEDWVEWLAEQARLLGVAYNALVELTAMLRNDERVEDADVESLWRRHVDRPVEAL